MEYRSPIVLAVLLLLSGLVHGAAYGGLALLPSIDVILAEDTVSVEMVEVEPEPEPEEIVEEEPEPEPEPEPERPAVVRERAPDPVEPAEPPPAEPPPPAEEAIAEFDGVTLTNEGPGESWASNVGTGQEITGPIGQPNAQVTGRVRHGDPGGVPGGTGDGPAVVPASDLSRSPRYGDMDRLRDLLEDNYPREARNQGIEGSAVVRIRVHSDGRVSVLGVVNESYETFGEACRDTLRQAGRWEPPLDRQGNAVDTITTFRCTLTIDF
jgi:protein TonB